MERSITEMSGKIRLSQKSVQTKSFMGKHQELDKQWDLFDAEGVILGRLAAVVASMLRGKHKPTFTPSVDCGDYVVITNAEKVAITGNKATDKKIYRHTGYPGGIKGVTRQALLVGDHPERVIEKAVQRMLPKGPLGRQMLSNLKVYAGAKHPHEAQAPKKVDFAAANAKNKRNG
jgi:large subunit ribosomal protein L13